MSFLRTDNFSLSIYLNGNAECAMSFPAGCRLDSNFLWTVRLVDIYLPKIAFSTSKIISEKEKKQEQISTNKRRDLLCYIRDKSNLIPPSYIGGCLESVLDVISYESYDEALIGLTKHGTFHQVMTHSFSHISFDFINGFFDLINFISSRGELKLIFERHIKNHYPMDDPGFYVYLPSIAPDQTGQNTAQSFKTFLYPIINLSKKYTWDVGVSSFFYVNSMINIMKPQHFDIYFYNQLLNIISQFNCTLLPGDYTTGEKLRDALVAAINHFHDGIHLTEYIDIEYSEITRRIRFFHKRSKDNPNVLKSINLTIKTKELANLLGVEMEKSHAFPVETKYALDFHPNFHAIYLYSDISSFQHIGSITAPILATFGMKGQSGDLICQQPQNITYTKVLNYDINSIHISLNTETGEPVPFESGFTQVVLHF